MVYKFEIGDRVFINHAKDPKYHGLVGEIEDIFPENGGMYFLSVFNKEGKRMLNKLYLPERLLRRFRQKTLQELEPGDIVINRSGLEFRVVEPISPVYFMSPIGSPQTIVNVTASDLMNDGFAIKGNRNESL